MDKDFQDLIDRFLLHPDSMPNEEKQHFMQEVASDPKKREQYHFTRLLKDTISQREEKLKFLHRLKRMELEVAALQPACCACPPPPPATKPKRQAAALKAKPQTQQPQQPARRIASRHNKLMWGGGIAAALGMGFMGLNHYMADMDSAADIAAPADLSDTPDTQPSMPLNQRGNYSNFSEENFEPDLAEPAAEAAPDTLDTPNDAEE